MNLDNSRSFTERFTPAVAQTYLDYAYKYQRKPSPAWRNTLTAAMRRGTFAGNLVIVGVFQERKSLLNGQHTLLSVIDSGVPVTLPVWEIQMEAEKDFARIYAEFDKGKRRTLAVGLAAYEVTYETYGVGSNAFLSAARSVKHILNNFRYEHSAGNEEDCKAIADKLLEWRDGVRNYLDILPSQNRKKELAQETDLRETMLRTDVFSTGIITFLDAPNKAAGFWTSVRFPKSIGGSLAGKYLGRWLSSSSGRIREGGGTSNIHPSADGVSTVVSQKCVQQAWNAHFSGSTVKSFKYDPGIPLRILGTRFA